MSTTTPATSLEDAGELLVPAALLHRTAEELARTFAGTTSSA